MHPRLGQSLGVALATATVVGGCAATTPATVAVPIAGSHQSIAVRDCFNAAASPFASVQTNERTLQPAPGNYALRCGDHTKGITHIDHDHPVQTDPDDFLRCVAATILDGYPTAEKLTGTTLFAAFYDGPAATSYVVIDDSSHDVLTAYTNTGAQGNNWRGCAGK